MSGNPIYNSLGEDLLYGGNIDPSVEAVDGRKGSLFLYTNETGGAPKILLKQDGGKNTNWLNLAVGDFLARDFSNALAAAVDIDLGGNKLVNVADPTVAQDAATKNYVDLADTALSSAIAGKLDLAGGTMTGNINSVTENQFISGNGVDSVVVGRNASGAGLHGIGSTSELVLGGVGQTQLASSSSRVIVSSGVGDTLIQSLAGRIDLSATDTINLSTSDNITLTGNFITLSPSGASFVSIIGRLDMNLTNKITRLADPTDAQDAATKNYVDTAVGAIPAGMAVNFSNSVASTKNLDLGGFGLTNTASISSSADLTLSSTGNMVFSSFGSFDKTYSGFTYYWGADIPALVIDGSTAEAQAQGGAAIVLDSGGLSCEFDIMTADRNSATQTDIILVSTGSNTGTGRSGGATFKSGFTATGESGNVTVASGISTGGNSGQTSLQSGGASAGLSGPVIVTSGISSGKSGDVTIASGNSSAGASGDIILSPSNVFSTARGRIRLDAFMAQLPIGTADPTGVANGDAYYNTSTNQLRVFNGGTWRGVTLT